MTSDLKHSGRRAFLRGAAGAAVALPLLEYTHGHRWGVAHAAQNDAPRRFITVFNHGGTISNMEREWRYDTNGSQHGLDWWRPSDPNTPTLTLGPIHEPLQPWVDRLLVIEGISNQAAFTYNIRGGHGTSNKTVLTAASLQGGEGGPPTGPSIDQVVAERLAAKQPVPFDRIHLKVKGQQYGTPYFRAADQPASGEMSPQAAFQTLFAGVSSGEPDPAAVQLLANRGSVLDGLQDAYANLAGRVSHTDKIMIEAHLDHIASLQQQLGDPIVCDVPAESSVGENGDGDVVASLHAQIIVAAIRCGLTNVANLEIADIHSPWVPNAQLRDTLPLGNNTGHALGHLAREVGPTGPHSQHIDAWKQYTLENRQWRMSVVAEIIAGLDDPTFLEGGRTILDNSLLLATSEFSNASRHSAYNLPVLLAGSAGGYFETGRFITYDTLADQPTLDFDSTESNHNLFTSILNALGEDDAHFGNDASHHQGPLPGLTA